VCLQQPSTTHNQMEVIMSNGSSDSTAASISMSNGLSRPLNASEIESLAQLDRLKLFLATAPSRWTSQGHSASSTHNQSLPSTLSPLPTVHPALNRFLLPSGEYVSCVLWSGLYHITGTDIVRALVFRFEAFGRPVVNMKKFEEGVFSDLRNLKPGTDACLEEPKVSYLIFSWISLLAAAIWPARFFTRRPSTPSSFTQPSVVCLYPPVFLLSPSVSPLVGP
jgi:transcription factor STE12